MTLNILTIVLNGMPYIQRHLPVFQELRIPWRWSIVEGQAGNTRDTSWCRSLTPSLSTDGTTEYLKELSSLPNVSVIQSPFWDNKTQMVNAGTSAFKSDGVLVQLDCDEVWTAEQLTKIVQLFEVHPDVARMQLYCNYYVGPDVVTVGENCYGNNDYEWVRAWRFNTRMRWNKHEPPVLNLNMGNMMPKHITRQHDLVFDHFSWHSEAQVAYKEKFYGYTNAVEHWKRLQANTLWPCRLKDFLPWVDHHARATRK